MKFTLTLLCFALSLASCNKRPKRVGWKSSGAPLSASAISDRPLDPAASETGDLAPPHPGLDLVWKRYRAFEQGLSQGLQLSAKDLCYELGSRKCVDEVHLTVLGGNEPYKAGQFDRGQAPTALTAVAVDRVVLSACSQRLELDRKAAGKAVVFKHFALYGPAPDRTKLEAQSQDLYRRILARDPSAAELKVIAGLGNQGLSNDKLALMLCYAIASSSENLLL